MLSMSMWLTAELVLTQLQQLMPLPHQMMHQLATLLLLETALLLKAL